jgi:hypothetical protein
MVMFHSYVSLPEGTICCRRFIATAACAGHLDDARHLVNEKWIDFTIEYAGKIHEKSPKTGKSPSKK